MQIGAHGRARLPSGIRSGCTNGIA